jgi:hypothetical protein
MLSGFVLGSLVALTSARADVTYTTSTGAVFKQVTVEGFGSAWRDPAGKTWSSYQGEFTNTALRPDWFGIVRHSEATLACQKIGGRLPSLHDYRKLMSHFEAKTIKVKGAKISIPTESAVADFLTIFPDAINPTTDALRTFWTTTVGAGNTAYHFVQAGGGRVVGDEDSREIAMSVRCIRDEFTN